MSDERPQQREPEEAPYESPEVDEIDTEASPSITAAGTSQGDQPLG